jgi:hypothetical protein
MDENEQCSNAFANSRARVKATFWFFSVPGGGCGASAKMSHQQLFSRRPKKNTYLRQRPQGGLGHVQ